MRKSLYSFINRHIVFLQLFLLVIALLLIIGTLFDWKIFKEEEKVTAVYYIEDSNKIDYKNLRMQGMNAASEDLNVSLFIHALPPHSPQLMNILNEKPDAIIIGDYVHKELDVFMSKANEQHIPILLADYATNTKESVYIGVDQHLSGIMAARHIAPLLYEKGNVAVIGYYEEGSSSFYVGKSAADEISSYSSLNVKANLRCTNENDSCIENIAELLEQNTINGIIALDTRSAEEVAQLIKQLDLAQDIKVVAFERSNSLLEYLQDGTVDALLIHNAFNLGYLSIQYADTMAKGEQIPSKEIMSTYVITRENMFWLQNQKLLFPLNDFY